MTEKTESDTSHVSGRDFFSGRKQPINRQNDSLIDDTWYNEPDVDFHEFAKENFLNSVVKKRSLDYYSAFLAFFSHLTNFEYLVVILLTITSTLFFGLYHADNKNPNVDNKDTWPLAARLRFNIIGTAIWLPSTILIQETSFRRESAMRKLGAFTALLLQIHCSLLTWRVDSKQKKFKMKNYPEFENRVTIVCLDLTNILFALLALPTVNRERYLHSKAGLQFKKKIQQNHDELVSQAQVCIVRLHFFVEELKIEYNFSPQESMRLFQFISMLQINLETLLMIKVKRTPGLARSFTRTSVLCSIFFYGAYYSFVAGNLVTDNAATTGVPFATMLSLLSTIIILGTITIHRTLEDPFHHRHRHAGNAIELEFQRDCLVEKIKTMAMKKPKY